VKLFVERAEAVKTGFQLTDDNAPSIAEICVHLDGIPLASELAAARLRVLNVEEITERLKDRFRLLVGYRTMQQRQQTLQSLIDWSYDLLLEDERALLRRLAVFAGGWTISAAEQICSGEILNEDEILDLLSHLVDKSLVNTELAEGSKRFRLLETIHEYSQMRLEEQNEDEVYTRKHAAYFLNMAEISFDELWGDKQESWLPHLEDDYGNMRKALEWLTKDTASKELLLRMAGALWRFWEIRGYFDEGRKWLTIALEAYPDAPAPLRANALRGAGILAFQQGDYARAKYIHTESLRLFRELGDRLGIARQVEKLGEVAYLQGEYAEAVEHHTDSLAQHYEIGDKEGMVVALIQLGMIARDRGQYQHAKDLLEESLELSREIKAKHLIAMALKNLGSVAQSLCEYPRANELYKEALGIYHSLNDRLGISNMLLSLGDTARDQGDFKQAIELLQECLEIKQGLEREEERDLLSEISWQQKE
jgi:non-specific serine/threonine protein kinase